MKILLLSVGVSESVSQPVGSTLRKEESLDDKNLYQPPRRKSIFLLVVEVVGMMMVMLAAAVASCLPEVSALEASTGSNFMMKRFGPQNIKTYTWKKKEQKQKRVLEEEQEQGGAGGSIQTSSVGTNTLKFDETAYLWLEDKDHRDYDWILFEGSRSKSNCERLANEVASQTDLEVVAFWLDTFLDEEENEVDYCLINISNLADVSELEPWFDTLEDIGGNQYDLDYYLDGWQFGNGVGPARYRISSSTCYNRTSTGSYENLGDGFCADSDGFWVYNIYQVISAGGSERKCQEAAEYAHDNGVTVLGYEIGPYYRSRGYFCSVLIRYSSSLTPDMFLQDSDIQLYEGLFANFTDIALIFGGSDGPITRAEPITREIYVISEEGDDDGASLGAIIGGAVGGAAAVLLIVGGILYYRRQKNDAGGPKTQAGGATQESIEVVHGMNNQGIAVIAPPPVAPASTFTQTQAYSVPPGPMGMAITLANGKHTITSIKDTSAVKHMFKIDDVVTMVDSENVATKTPAELSAILASKANQTRTIVVERVVTVEEQAAPAPETDEFDC